MLDADPHWQSGNAGFDRRDQPLVAQYGRVNPPGQFAEVLESLARVSLQFLEGAVGKRQVSGQLVPREPDFRHERDQLLLYAVVEISLNAPPRGLFRLNQANPRGRQFPGLMLDLLEPLFQLGGQVGVA
jgi:hypothetical protein